MPEHTTTGGFAAASRQGRLLALALAIGLVYAIDHRQTQSLPLLGFYWVPVLLATSFASVRQVAALNLLALALAVASGWSLGFFLRMPGEYALRLSAVTAISLVTLRITHMRIRQEGRLQAANRELTATLQAIPDLLFEVDREGVFLKIQALKPEWLLRPADALRGQRLDQVLPLAASRAVAQALAEAEREGVSVGQQICLPLPSGDRWFELSVARSDHPQGLPGTYVVLSRDIQARKEAEAALGRQVRFYRVLSRCGRAMESANSRLEMLKAVCQEAVSTGDLTMAWAGFLDADTSLVQPVAMAGEGLPYLEGLQISADPHSPYGQGPTGRCLRSGQPYWCQDFCHDPATAAWHEKAQLCGWGSSASLPLRCQGQVVGALNLYAPSPQAFSKDIKAPLLDMVVDVNLALERFQREEQQQQVRDQLAISERNYRQLTETIHDVIWRLDAHTLAIRYVSPAVQAVLGYPPGELLDQPFTSTLHRASLPWQGAIQAFATSQQQDQQSLTAQVETALPYRVDELQQCHRNGSMLWSEITTTLATNAITGAQELYCVSRDITARKQAETQLDHLAYYDPLTDLPNRTLIRNLIDQALRSARRGGQPLALLVVGLDRFKAINDAISYDTGDAVLVEVARRLRQHLRDNDLIGRIGSDEFVLALAGANAPQAAQLCERIQQAVRQPIRCAQQTITLTSSIGVALFPADGNDQDTLIRKAHAAMAQAKRDGRDRLRFSTAALELQVMRQLDLARELYGAINREELRLLYQPQMDARTGALVGVEVLLRWHHHRLGVVPPAEFIPIAESNGLILPIGEWVLQEAIQQLARWQQQGLAPIQLAVNLSAVQFRQQDLAERVLAHLERSGLAPACLELELTESVLIEDPEAAIAAMDRFSSAGIQLSIDDFGTGYSSLSYLKRLRVHKLKIDASFVRDLGVSESDTSIVQAILNLAWGMGMQSIAEGVETNRQLEVLRAMGCDQIQGFLYAKPLAADAFATFARSSSRPLQP